ncbi:YceD family protein [Bifidobacterium choerinum]|uniref:DNA-binding protein n=1 Tax=Bifidobacterium choerinum TaxID=35760 RepID=A0A2D3D5Q3_9BIFI|nr:DUF177 domain-containing protein [Bifidobacterium choerinum]ATU20186.1 DNA-binding protein [Bifidobacterium choerinum]
MARVQYTDWTVPVAQVGSHAGQQMPLDRVFPAPSGIGDDIVGVTEGADVHVNGQFDSIVDGLIFTGTFTAPVHAVCSRCDTPLDDDWSEQVTAFFPYEEEQSESKGGKGRKQDEDVEIIAGEDEAENVYPLMDNGSFADLEALIRDTFVDALPLQPLCRPDCRGLCPQCGIDLNEYPDHHHETTDIRFAGLEALKARLEAAEGSADGE